MIVVAPYVKPCYVRIQDRFFPKEHFSKQSSDKDVLDKVYKTSLNLKDVKMSMGDMKGLPIDLKNFFLPKRHSSIQNNYYTSYAISGVSYYAIQQRDSIVMNKLKIKTDEFIDSKNKKLVYPIKKIDQVPIGLLLLNLYRWYHDDEYLLTARSLYSTVINMKDYQGRILYVKDSDVDLDDVLGMCIPFLMEYYNVTHDSTALVTVNENMERFHRYAVNPRTGLPAHGYNLRTGIPVGSANWGRGIGWYLLASAFCPQIEDNILDNTLFNLDYTQFPGSSSNYDSSYSIMCEIYKQSKNKKRKLSLQFIKSHILKNGMVDDCSGDTYGLNNYSHTFGESELCNGLLLILASKFAN